MPESQAHGGAEDPDRTPRASDLKKYNPSRKTPHKTVRTRPAKCPCKTLHKTATQDRSVCVHKAGLVRTRFLSSVKYSSWDKGLPNALRLTGGGGTVGQQTVSADRLGWSRGHNASQQGEQKHVTQISTVSLRAKKKNQANIIKKSLLGVCDGEAHDI